MIVTGIRTATPRPLSKEPPSGPLLAAPAQTVAPQGHPRRIDLSQGRTVTTRQWWQLHTGHLRHERPLLPCRLVQRVLYKRKAGKAKDAAALLNHFFQTITMDDGRSCIALARHYVQDPAHRKDALDLYRAAETAGALRDVDDVLCTAQLLCDAGNAAAAIGIIAGHQRSAPTDARLATWSGVAWLTRACQVSNERPEFFASAQERAVKALRVAVTLSPADPRLADNVAAAEAIYPGPTFGNIVRALDTPLCDTPNLRAALLDALERHVNYTLQRTYAVGTAVRVESKHMRRQQNVDAVNALRRAP